MKILRISEDKKCFYNIDGKEQPIMDISKDDILKILMYIYNDDKGVEFDGYTEVNILNEAEKVIYSQLYEKFVDFNKKKDTLKNEIDLLFKPVKEKYLRN